MDYTFMIGTLQADDPHFMETIAHMLESIDGEITACKHKLDCYRTLLPLHDLLQQITATGYTLDGTLSDADVTLYFGTLEIALFAAQSRRQRRKARKLQHLYKTALKTLPNPAQDLRDTLYRLQKHRDDAIERLYPRTKLIKEAGPMERGHITCNIFYREGTTIQYRPVITPFFDDAEGILHLEAYNEALMQGMQAIRPYELARWTRSIFDDIYTTHEKLDTLDELADATHILFEEDGSYTLDTPSASELEQLRHRYQKHPKKHL